MKHSCSPNTYHIALKSRFLVLRASRPLIKDEPITICRVDSTKCNIFRNRLLDEACVDCSCPRCMDGTEMGTGYGSLICLQCEGLLTSSNPKDKDAKWICSGCKIEELGTECVKIFDDLDKDLGVLSNDADNDKDSVLAFEKILLGEGVWSRIPEHSQLFQDIRYRLIFIYQYHKDFYFADQGFLKAKMDHCDRWLQLADILFQGRAYSKVMILHEKICAMVGLMHWMKLNFQPVPEVNSFISEINKEASWPIQMMVLEEDQSLCNSIRQMNKVAVEAREEQKQRIIINRWAYDEDEEW